MLDTFTLLAYAITHMSFDSLTPKQKTVFAAMRELQTVLGRLPKLDEIKDHLGYSSVSSVQRHVDELKRKGYVDESRALNTEHSHMVSIPLVGNVACGIPLIAEENVEAFVSYNSNKLRGSPKEYFCLRAIGDSMNRAGICDGDIVLARQCSTADPGERVVALVGDDATLKKLVKENNHWVLRPESDNTKHKDLIMLDDFSIQGVVVGTEENLAT